MKTNTAFQQKRKVGTAGEFFNQLMGNNATLPEVGKGATVLHYSDRSPYQVVEVSADGTNAKLEVYEAKHDPSKAGGEGHQNWILEPTGRFVTVEWRSSRWCFVGTEIIFTPSFRREAEARGFKYPAMALTKKQHDEIYNGDRGAFPAKVIKGITKEKSKYTSVSIIFGRMEYHYDWSF